MGCICSSNLPDSTRLDLTTPPYLMANGQGYVFVSRVDSKGMELESATPLSLQRGLMSTGAAPMAGLLLTLGRLATSIGDCTLRRPWLRTVKAGVGGCVMGRTSD